MTAPVFLIPAASAASAQVGGTVVVGGDEGRHAVAVQRLRVGEKVDLADGEGRRLTCVVAEVRMKPEATLVVQVEAVVQEPREPGELTLVQALAKGGRDEQAVESAVELGVDRVIPWQAERCVALWRRDKSDRDKAGKGRQRWQATVRAATKQSRRAYLAPVSDVMTSGELVQAVERWVADGTHVLVLHESASRPWSDLADDLSIGHGRVRETAVALIVGPEGGISDAELAALQAAGATPVRMGRGVLRTSSAGPAAVAALSPLVGRW